MADLFAEIKYGLYYFFYGTICRMKEPELSKFVMSRLTDTQIIFFKGQEIFNEDICIENLLRSVHKLQSAVAALMDDNDEKAQTAK